MSRDILIVDGRAYSWKQLCELRRAQRDAQRSAAAQPALFELHDDCRPAAERTAARRYSEPSLLDRLRE
jgi:hypothetical protein